MPAKIVFNTREFRTSHMKEPRGYGRWGFFFFFESRGEAWFTSGTFAEAKRAAKEEARRRFSQGIVVIEVAP